MEFIYQTLYPKIETFLSIVEKEIQNSNIFYSKSTFGYRVHPLYDNLNYNDLEAGLLYLRREQEQEQEQEKDDGYIKIWNYKLRHSLFMYYGDKEEDKT